MMGHIDKAINYLQLYRLDKNPEYLVMAHREIKREVKEIKELSLTRASSTNSSEGGDKAE